MTTNDIPAIRATDPHARTYVHALCDEVEQLRTRVADRNASLDRVIAERNAVTAELTKVQEQLTAANRRADGLQNDLDSAQRGLTAYANENARLRQDRDTKADIAKNRADVITDLGEVIERVEQRANAHAAVVEAAKAWAEAYGSKAENMAGNRATALVAAVDALPKAEAAAEHRCPNCAPGYDCERGIYTPAGAIR